MTTKTQKKNTTEKHRRKIYTDKEIDEATDIIGDLMNQASSDIWDILISYKFTPGCIYGILESIKLTVANDVYTVSLEDPHICKDCEDIIKNQEKSSPKKVKEINSAMYT